jgi:hypothetical protein
VSVRLTPLDGVTVPDIYAIVNPARAFGIQNYHGFALTES